MSVTRHFPMPVYSAQCTHKCSTRSQCHAWIDIIMSTKAHSIKTKPALHSQVPVYIQRNIHTYEASDPNGMNHDDHNFTKGIYTQIRYKHRPSLQHWCIQLNANTYTAPDPAVCGPQTIWLYRHAHVIATA